MKTIVIIEWDEPEVENWLCPGNIELALSSYCKNTKFKVSKFELELPESEKTESYLKQFRTEFNFDDNVYFIRELSGFVTISRNS